MKKKIYLSQSWGMYSKAGDNAVQRMYDKVIGLSVGKTPIEIEQTITDETSKIKKKHGEVTDTDVKDRFICGVRDVTQLEISMYCM